MPETTYEQELRGLLDELKVANETFVKDQLKPLQQQLTACT